MKETIILRPHHVLCLRLFAGEGYDDNFVDNMYDVIDRIEERGALITLKTVPDEVCKKCPHNLGYACEFEDSVKQKDAAVLAFFDLHEGMSLSAKELQSKVDAGISQIGDVLDICGECEWSQTCNSVLNSKIASKK